jgi:hypothetical protein
MSTFVFFHVGADTSKPKMLVNSIRITNPNSKIIQCSDEITEKIDEVTEIFRTEGDIKNLMIFRLEAFSKLGLTEPAIYLDTDMLVIKPVNPEKILEERKVILCERTFNKNCVFNVNQRGLNFSEYSGRTLGEIYPFLACATITKKWDFWNELCQILKEMDKKFLQWYGDQEAMREWYKSNGNDSLKFLAESEYACLPEEKSYLNQAKIVHFKGGSRKELMEIFYSILCQPKTQKTKTYETLDILN